jgi:hypothetical protein
MRPGTERGGAQAAKDALAAAVCQHVVGEYVLSDPSRRQEDPFGLQFRQHTFAAVLLDLVAEGRFEHGDVEFLLAEQSKLAAILQVQEVRQPGLADALGPGSMQQHPVSAAKPRRVVAQHGAGQDIPLRAMRAGTIQVCHFRQHAGWRPRE